LVEPAIRTQLEQVQRVEFASSPDGPYQYLCLRHNPYNQWFKGNGNEGSRIENKLNFLLTIQTK